MSTDGETVTPAWGALPVEQYLIRNWDPSSELSADEQRAELVAAYIDEDVLDMDLLSLPPSRLPTATEIAEILAPWRPQKLRRIAAAHLNGSPHYYYFLRTHYAGGAADDAKPRSWLDLEPLEGADISPENEWFSVLDDAELFDFGDAWQEVYGVLPELAAPQPDRRFTDHGIWYARKTARDMVAPEEPEDKYYQDAIMEYATIGTMWLLVLDEEAFEPEELGLILRDKKGNPVKETTIRPEELGAFYITWSRGATSESGYWEYAAVGKKYRTRGKIMRKLLPMVKGE
ncbi:hypothetical protein MFIFM68171_07912 [Madurella fahalii]|uniref:Uncharacterized protein n=1 Tax=Madurella fahalii TaxID=1157608 RepID=A0ABQ0GIW1_9PEZI